ncbi:MAG: VOC family protein [Acetobacterium sp.]
MARVVHFEFAAENPERAIDFYTKTFGWKFDKWEGGGFDYWLITTGQASELGIDGGMGLKATSYAGVNNAIYIEDIDKAIEDVKKNGGTMISEKVELSGMGTIAYFKDTEGNVFCLFQGGEM